MFWPITLPFSLKKNVCSPINETCKLAKTRGINNHFRNKRFCDQHYIKPKFHVGNKVIYEEFKFPNTRNLWLTFNGFYRIISTLPDVIYEIDRPNYRAGNKYEVVHVSKLRPYNSDKFKLSREEQEVKIELI